MRNWEMHAVKAAAASIAAGQQHEIAMSIPHGFRADAEQRTQHHAELDVEKGMWRSQRRAASIATNEFLREHGVSVWTGRSRKR
jgi:hypothetical protein